ncbi:hypothetical protein FRC09_002087 [Ceratobasidium sp. 395]|nr:hypothetical protein FRC09_002087 [Ceratobasidium sp. 395]
MRDLGELRHFLGIHFERQRDLGIIVMKQTAYIDSTVNSTGLRDAYPADIPLSPTTHLTRWEGRSPNFPSATLVGKLMYAALRTHPDITYAVSHLSQFTSCFGPAHVTAIKHLVRYLKATSRVGLVFRRSEDFGETGYSDAN